MSLFEGVAEREPTIAFFLETLTSARPGVKSERWSCSLVLVEGIRKL